MSDVATAVPLAVEIDAVSEVRAPGHILSGRVRLLAGRPDYTRVAVSLLWRVHGRGSPFEEEVETRTLIEYPPSPDRGEIREYPFRFRLPHGPPSFQGTLMDLDWFVRARAELGWNRQDVAECPFRLLPGDGRGLAFGPGAIGAGADLAAAGSRARPLLRRLWPLESLGELWMGGLRIDAFPEDPCPGEPVGFEARFTPRLRLRHGDARLEVRCVERVLLEEGGQSVRVERFRTRLRLAGPGEWPRAEPVVLRTGVWLPGEVPPSLLASPQAEVAWSARFEVPLRIGLFARRTLRFRVHPAPERPPERTGEDERYMPPRREPGEA